MHSLLEETPKTEKNMKHLMEEIITEKESGDFLEDEDLDQIHSLLVSDRFIRSIVGKESYSRWKNVFKDKRKKKKK